MPSERGGEEKREEEEMKRGREEERTCVLENVMVLGMSSLHG